MSHRVGGFPIAAMAIDLTTSSIYYISSEDQVSVQCALSVGWAVCVLSAPHLSTPHSSLLTPHSSLLNPHCFFLVPLSLLSQPLIAHSSSPHSLSHPSSPLTPHPSPLTSHSSPLTPHSSPLTPHPQLIYSRHWNATTYELIQEKATPIITCCLATPEDLAVDWMGRNLYWSDSERGVIEASRLDGSGRRIIASGLDQPSLIELYPRRPHG